jgi:hypothetical protein
MPYAINSNPGLAASPDIARHHIVSLVSDFDGGKDRPSGRRLINRSVHLPEHVFGTGNFRVRRLHLLIRRGVAVREDSGSGRLTQLIQRVNGGSGFFKTAQAFDERHQSFERFVVVFFKQFGKFLFVHYRTPFAIGI